MILVRVVFQARNGKAGELVADMKQALDHMKRGDQRGRLLTDLSGPLDTVVLESVHASLAAWEQFRAAMFASPEFQQGNATITGPHRLRPPGILHHRSRVVTGQPVWGWAATRRSRSPPNTPASTGARSLVAMHHSDATEQPPITPGA